MKTVIIGGGAGGASAAARLRRLDENAQVIILEQGNHVSYSNCSLPYYLGGVVEELEDLIMMDPESFRSMYNIDARVCHSAVSIDRGNRIVHVRNLKDGSFYDEPYDKLVLSPGARPVRPRSIKGIDGDNVFVIRNVDDVDMIKKHMTERGVKEAAVVGGGFIGIEAAENLMRAGCSVHLIEGEDQILAPFDHDMVQILHKELFDNGCDLRLSTMVREITGSSVIAETNGETVEIPADMVIMAAGVAADTELAREAGLEIGESGGIRVNEYFQTNDPDIYAVGDAVEIKNMITGRYGKLALAGPAIKAARIAADHIYHIERPFKGYAGSSCLRVFSMNAASTGINEKTASDMGYSFDSVMTFANDKVGIMPDAHYMAFKLLFELPSGRILGAQAIGKGAADKRIDAVAALICMGGTIDDLKDVQLCYSPVYGTARDVVNLAALVAENVLSGALKQIHVDMVRGLVESGACIIDVREEGEYKRGHIKNAVNIPLSTLRKRIGEIPKDRPVYLHCRSSQRSYNALCALRGNGYENVTNISGSMLGISLYEYYNDVSMKREPIVTAYNFN